jgi:hypothetical protein
MGRAEDAQAAPILPQEICRLLGKLPPQGHSYRLLGLWFERHALERQLELQHRAGALVDRHPACPVRISRRVDRITARLDRIQQLLSNPLRAAAALDRWEVA